MEGNEVKNISSLIGFVFFISTANADLYSDFVTDCVDGKMSESTVKDRYLAVVKETETEIKKMVESGSTVSFCSCFDDDIGYSELQSYIYRLENLSLDSIWRIGVTSECHKRLKELGAEYETKESLFKLANVPTDLFDD